MPSLSICKSYGFAAAHHLPYHEGKCHRLHGHNYKLEVEVSGSVNQVDHKSDYGMVIDFYVLDNIVESLLDSVVDHYYLNKTDMPYPTAENLAVWFWDQISSALPVHVSMERIRLYETDKAYAEYYGSSDDDDLGDFPGSYELPGE